MRLGKHLVIAIVAAVALIPLVAALFTACSRCAPVPAGPSSAAAGKTSLTAGPTPGKTGLWGQEFVEVRAHGAGFSDAAQVTFELLNTSDARGETFWLEGTRHGDGWSASFDPGVYGVGDYRVVAQAAGADGSAGPREQTPYRCTETFGPSSHITVAGGDYDVAHGMAGLKVLRIQDVFGNGLDHYPRYLGHTEQCVEDFQKAHGLPVTGVVDKATWLALGLKADEWSELGAYVSPATVGAHASSAERVEAMVARARDYLGDTYIWDAAGAPGQGVDCAGLVIQALYAAGWDTGIVNPVTHSTTGWGDQDAANLYGFCNLAEVEPDEMRRGDLVFYGKDGVVDHVAIYLGDGQVIEAHTSGVRIERADYRKIMGARRVFS